MNKSATVEQNQSRWITPFLVIIAIAASAAAIAKMWQNAKLAEIEHPIEAAHEILALSSVKGAVSSEVLEKARQAPHQLTAREYWRAVLRTNDRCASLSDKERDEIIEPCTLAKILLTTTDKQH